MLVTVPAFADVRSIVSAARQLRPDLPIIARADGPEAVRALYALGIQEVTSPEFEAAIEMTRQASDSSQRARARRPARGQRDPARALWRARQTLDDQRAILSQIGEMTRQLDFTWLRLPADSPFDGRTLGELQIRTTTGASVVGVVHAGVP